MTVLDSKVQGFCKGTGWQAKHGRLALPVLVSWVERYKGRIDAQIPELTYGDLAAMVATRKHAHPIRYALGTLGHALKELAEQPEWPYGEIPRIQLLVWSKGEGSPGESAFGFLKISKPKAEAMGKYGRHMIALVERSNILAYPHWREVLTALGLKPLTLKLPTVSHVIASPNGDYGDEPESEHHRRLKLFLATHYDALGLKDRFNAAIEVQLMSGDQADLILDHVLGERRVCVEAKSRVSNDGDLIRGIFQCVKYQAVLEAQEKYESKLSSEHRARAIEVILATERELAEPLRTLSEILQVRVMKVKVPKSFDPPV